jgi:AraC-like DNA-binding protein
LLEHEGSAPVSLSAGDVAVVPKGGAHVLRDAPGSPIQTLGAGVCSKHRVSPEPIRLGGDGARALLIAGAFEFLSGRRTCLLERLPPLIHLPANDPGSAPWLPATVQLFVAESATARPGGSVVMSRLADVLFVQALRAQMTEKACQEHGLPALADPQIGRAMGLMHARLGDAWTVERLAESVGLSRSGFAARFTELVGEPPLQYLARWRMTKAAQALRETDATIPDVAERVGYQSEASFNKAFKRWEGTGPGAYRRTHRERSSGAVRVSAS